MIFSLSPLSAEPVLICREAQSVVVGGELVLEPAVCNGVVAGVIRIDADEGTGASMLSMSVAQVRQRWENVPIFRFLACAFEAL